MPTISVVVRDGDTCVATKERPVRRLPDGRYGAIYMGTVYPLLPGRSIDISQLGYPKESCPPLASIPEDLAHSGTREREVYLDDSGYYRYLMIGGVDEATFDDVVDLYVANGHTLLGAGRSLRPADNGVQYDWYIRLPRPDGLARIDEGSAPEGQERAAADQLTQILDFALGPNQEAVSAAATDVAAAQLARIQFLEGTVQSLSSTLAQTSMDLTSERERATKLSRELMRVRSDLILAREAAAAHRRLADAAKADRPTAAASLTTAGGDNATVTNLENEVKRLTKELADAKELEQVALNDNEVLRQQAAASAEEATTLKAAQSRMAARLEDLEELSNAADSMRQGSTGAASADDMLQATIESLCPDVHLQRNSLEVVRQALTDGGTDILGVIARIQYAEEKVNAERVESATDWRELHFRAKTFPGRLYYTRSRTPRRILVSEKTRQPRDIDWLKRKHG